MWTQLLVSSYPLVNGNMLNDQCTWAHRRLLVCRIEIRVHSQPTPPLPPLHSSPPPSLLLSGLLSCSLLRSDASINNCNCYTLNLFPLFLYAEQIPIKFIERNNKKKMEYMCHVEFCGSWGEWVAVRGVEVEHWPHLSPHPGYNLC